MADIERTDRAFLTRKLLCTCPICQKRIYGGMLGLNEIDVSKIKRFPFSYTYVHTHDQPCVIPNTISPKHAITLYFDANLSVRSVEESQIFKED